ncbi:hypothetical protein [Desulfuromonas thiophila]|uniref:Uncharacterized protein n=1 Tax=Desulfuromonas thiophila TaxID=57664 RepID=A0A1G6X347_9BACT|nr:hypothetical protein [Desulfuromonas thiophila]SDD71695.1 hypothetical protein SAMN05661003_10199 [Desulfuromonas thiophila]
MLSQLPRDDRLDPVKTKLNDLVEEVFRHDGYGRIEVDMRFLRRGQKEIILRCGKEYRFVVDFVEEA